MQNNHAPERPLFFKIIACEIALREICHLAAHTRNLVDLDFLTQGHHDVPIKGREDIQRHIDATPAGKYDALLIGYGLCSNILTGLTARDTQLVIPRAHDCITFFLGSKARYQEMFNNQPGTYYYTSGWLECRQRRGNDPTQSQGQFLPAHSKAGMKETYEGWVKKYGEEQAQYLFEVMSQWTEGYTHGALIDFNFSKPLELQEQVRQICQERNWEFREIEGDLKLLRDWLDGPWDPKEFLVVPPGRTVIATFDDDIIGLKPVAAEQAG